MDPAIVWILVSAVALTALGAYRMRPGFPLLGLILSLAAAYGAFFDQSVLVKSNQTVFGNSTITTYTYQPSLTAAPVAYLSVGLAIFNVALLVMSSLRWWTR